MTYLVSPVSYVGILHAAILKSQSESDTVANLPSSVNLWVLPLPVLLAWMFPSGKRLLGLLLTALVVNGATGGLVALLFAFGDAHLWKYALITHAGVIGITIGVQNMCLWELIGRGLSKKVRGQTLWWTFALGPLFAVSASCVSQLILSGDFVGLIRWGPLDKPWSYAVIFGASCPAMWIAAIVATMARVPPETEHTDANRLDHVLTGIRQYLTNPLILAAAIGFLCTYGGTLITNNLSLFAKEAMHEEPEKYAGLQLALRFGFKCLAGFALGFVVTRVHAKATLLMTTATCLLGVMWALVIPGKWYLLSFGLLGGGELFYVYYLNYIVGCSPPERMREYTAYTNLLIFAVGWVPVTLGLISDRYGLRASFVAASGFLLAALVIVTWRLPRNPILIRPNQKGADLE